MALTAKQAKAAYQAVSTAINGLFVNERRVSLLALIILRHHRPDSLPTDHGNPNEAKCSGHFNAIEEEFTWPCPEYEAMLSVLDFGWSVHNEKIARYSE